MSAKRAHVPVAERRRQLIEAAMVVMRRDGAWALTTRAVAAQAGVPLGAVHYAFDSKDALIEKVLEADIESAARTFDAAAAAGGSIAEIAERVLQRWFEALREDPLTETVLQELTLMGARDESLRRLAGSAVIGYRRQLEGFLEEMARRADGEWDAPVPVLAETVFGQFVGLAQGWLCTHDDALMRACLADLAHVLQSRLRY